MSGACWLCGRPIDDPPEIIGQYLVGQIRLAHRHCFQILGELDPTPAPSRPRGARQ